MDKSFQPHGENLRHAIKWLSQRTQLSGGRATRELIEQASVKFDLTPLEEDFLIRKFIHSPES